jgi:hypothetical protein
VLSPQDRVVAPLSTLAYEAIEGMDLLNAEVGGARHDVLV